MSVEHLDELITGADLSGIGVAYHPMQQCPSKRFAILEGRDALGVRWDLFRYPGIRAGSDMFTLGYNVKLWAVPQKSADAPSIHRFIDETVRENGIDAKIRYRHRVLKADGCSKTVRWTLMVDLSSEYFCRLIVHMGVIGMRQCAPAHRVGEAPFLNLTSGSIQRAAERAPRQNDPVPWKRYQNYLLDLLLRYGKRGDGYLNSARCNAAWMPRHSALLYEAASLSG